jgi:hypothetical protein
MALSGLTILTFPGGIGAGGNPGGVYPSGLPPAPLVDHSRGSQGSLLRKDCQQRRRGVHPLP